jgi:ABC-type uncharacterized transport system substrate-binding protein
MRPGRRAFFLAGLCAAGGMASAQPAHLEVVLNQRVANALGVTFPPEVMMRATKVIE